MAGRARRPRAPLRHNPSPLDLACFRAARIGVQSTVRDLSHSKSTRDTHSLPCRPPAASFPRGPAGIRPPGQAHDPATHLASGSSAEGGLRPTRSAWGVSPHSFSRAACAGPRRRHEDAEERDDSDAAACGCAGREEGSRPPPRRPRRRVHMSTPCTRAAHCTGSCLRRLLSSWPLARALALLHCTRSSLRRLLSS